jgi:hypothetical protein
MRSLLTKRVCLTLTNYGMLAFTSISNAGIFPLFLWSPVHLGGLGLRAAQVSTTFCYRVATLSDSNSPYQIGTVMSIQAILTSTLQFVLFPPIQRRFGTIKTFRLAVIFYVLGYSMYPIAGWVARHEVRSASTGWNPVYIPLGIQVFCLSLANLVSTLLLFLILRRRQAECNMIQLGLFLQYAPHQCFRAFTTSAWHSERHGSDDVFAGPLSRSSYRARSFRSKRTKALVRRSGGLGIRYSMLAMLVRNELASNGCYSFLERRSHRGHRERR